MAELRNTPGK
jgi:hypothetical protein